VSFLCGRISTRTRLLMSRISSALWPSAHCAGECGSHARAADHLDRNPGFTHRLEHADVRESPRAAAEHHADRAPGEHARQTPEVAILGPSHLMMFFHVRPVPEPRARSRGKRRAVLMNEDEQLLLIFM
jgi:hypothetical protein